MARTSPRSVIGVLAVTAACLLLTSCFSVESSFTIHDDGTADVSMVTLVDTSRLEELASMLGEDMGPVGDLSPESLLEELGDDNPCEQLVGDLTGFDVETEEITNDGEVGVGCTVKGVPIEDLTASMQDDESSFTITQEGDATSFSATLTGVDELAGDPDEMTAMTEMLDVNLDDLFSITFSVTAPGSLGDNNASSTSGSTATWDVKPDADFVTSGDATMTAEWSGSSSSSSSTLWIILGIIAAIVIIGAIIYFLKRRKSGDATGTATTPADGPVMTPPPPPGAPGAPVAPTSSFDPPPPPPPVAPPPVDASPMDVPPPAAPPSSPPTSSPPTAPPPPPPPG